MSYFNHAFQKVFWAGGTTGYINTASVNSVNLLSTYGVGAVTFADQNQPGWPSVIAASTPVTSGKPLTLLATSLYGNDKIGPFHGGYQETTKSKTINPRYISRFYRVDESPAQTHIIGIGSTPNLDLTTGACCPTFYCNETYNLRIDMKGSPALRVLNHNYYQVASAFTGCCADPTPGLVDPATVMIEWAKYITADPIFWGVYEQNSQRLVNVGMTVTCDGGDTWSLYLPNNAQAGVAGIYFAADGTTLTATGTAFRNSIQSSITGRAATTNTLVGGTGYADATGVATTGGTGSGLTVNIVTSSGVVTGVTIANNGSGYTVGDVITIAGGGGNATFHVATIANLSFSTVAPMSAYDSTFDPDAPNCCAGLVMEAAFVETKFGDCSFETTDKFEIEPLLIQASLLDETGDPCAFEQLCISDGITPSGASLQSGLGTVYPAIQFGKQAEGTGEQVLRDLILSERYSQNHFASGDMRIREITQGFDVLGAVDRNILYTNYYIQHSIPRHNNPSGTFDSDQYLLKIPMTAPSAAFEAFMAAWLTAANSIVTLETY